MLGNNNGGSGGATLNLVDEVTTPLWFVVSVDTEADDAWSRPETVDVTNIRQLDRFQDLCDAYEIVPTYLLAYECATRDEALSILQPIAQNRHCEIGHHLHVWTTPPFQNEGPNEVDLDWIHAFQFQLPDSLFEEKAEQLRQAIERNFGHSPTSHRAGRWGIDQRTVDWLASRDFIVETSMRPGLRLREFMPGMELSSPADNEIACTRYELRNNPYLWPSSSDVGGRGTVIEIPATIDMPTGLLSNTYLRFLSLQWPGEYFLFKVFRKLAGLDILCPNPAYAPGELPRMMERAINRGVTVINLMFHSSELSLHCSPFTKTQQNLDNVWRHLEEAFRFARDRGIQSKGISDVALMTRLRTKSG